MTEEKKNDKNEEKRDEKKSDVLDVGQKAEENVLSGVDKKPAKTRALKSKKPKVLKMIKRGQAYIQATYNNTIISLCDQNGNVLAWASAGKLGFKGAKKATPYAAGVVVKDAVLRAVEERGLREVNVFVKGVGAGREGAVRALQANGLTVLAIKDITPIPHNGCRPKKVRRV